MFPRILTDLERKRIRTFLKADGHKDVAMRKIASRAKAYLPTIRSDLDLLDQLLKTYQKEATARKA